MKLKLLALVLALQWEKGQSRVLSLFVLKII